MGVTEDDELGDAEEEVVGNTFTRRAHSEGYFPQENDSDVDARDMTEEEVRMLMSEANEERMAASDVLLNIFILNILGQTNPKSTSMNLSLRQSSGMLAYKLILYSFVYSSLRHILVL